MSIHVADRVWADIATIGALVAGRAIHRLPAADHRSARRMPPWRARQFLAGRALLRALLNEVSPRAWRAELVSGPTGQPTLAGYPEVGVSVAHDGDSVAVAVGLGAPVGVDVQHPPAAPPGPLVRRCLRQRAGDLYALPTADQAVEFTWVWTVQEACVKADGTGLTGRPWAVDVPVPPRSGSWRDLRWIALREHTETPLSCAFRESTC